MKVFLNGAPVECVATVTVEGLLQSRRLSLATTLVERNGAAMHRREWVGQRLQENDRLEILQVAAGG